MTLSRRAAAVSLITLSLGTMAAPPQAAGPARVMLLGTFHFDNPGQDAVKFQPIDVLQPAPQRYLDGLVQRLVAFKPTRVMLEYSQQADERFNQRYQAYRKGEFKLQLNEIYQIGFRVAHGAGLARVDSVDEEVPGTADEALFKNMPSRDPAAWQRLMDKVAEMSQRFQKQHREQGLGQILASSNTPAADRENKGFYMLFNAVGGGQREYLGADSAAAWWQRNLRMYARIQHLAQPGERVLVIAGSGHTAILRDLLAADDQRVEEPVLRYLVE
ncbi:hypothetical protein HNQ51_002023 [Inhella inkyongensis]|uniref:TraB/GumN family protein n=1 Tax=Inhella inkyongensis TaxID=392593 RepID=A0A840S8G6_9BURK|nr:DUF5694 domain-containing protein [Inhella inkyongensis]MBB5204709.1 hypothetical protein [Inhella inkyongensis]